MSRFYGSLEGMAKTTATRRGSANKPSKAHVRGWDCGVKIEAYAGDDGEDCFAVIVTGGSNGKHPDKLIGVVKNLEFHKNF